MIRPNSSPLNPNRFSDAASIESLTAFRLSESFFSSASTLNSCLLIPNCLASNSFAFFSFIAAFPLLKSVLPKPPRVDMPGIAERLSVKGFVLSFALPDGVQWKVNIGDANNRADINTGGNIIDNEWYTLSVSFDRDGFMKMFLDGVFIDQTNISEIGDINTGSGLYFGADINSSFDFSGAIAEVRVWNTVIENGTINSWYCTGIDSSHPDYGSLIGYWKLNEDSDSVALDTSIYGNDGTVTGSIWDSPNLEAYDYSETPRIVDVPYTALAHLCIPIQEDWGLDGESWIPNCDVLGVSTGVLDLEVQIFPNPVADNLNITVINIKDYKEIVLEIHTISGKKIHQQVLLNQKTIVNLFDISEGVYFLKIRTEDGFIIKKIVKTS